MKPAWPDSSTQLHRSITLKKFLHGRLIMLGIYETHAPLGWEGKVVGPHVKTQNYITRGHHNIGTIVILPPRVRERLASVHPARCRDYILDLASSRAAAVIFARCKGPSGDLKNEFLRHRLPVMLSTLHESTLEGRLYAVIQEKFRGRITLHAVAFGHKGKAVLVTGPSGIGKTTAVMHLMCAGGCWIADDTVVIRKNSEGSLWAGGHPRVRDYLHTSETGIVPVGSALKYARIRKKVELGGIIDVIQVGNEACGFSAGRKIIMGKSLPRVCVRVPDGSFFDKNMLIRALQTLER
jgi:serine kinase of HPr protein (carbohydrate metabolism regulator)